MIGCERNIRLLLAFDGTNYAGWQKQASRPTIQGEVEARLAVMTGERPVVHGAGRTDAGVHAVGMVANFSTTTKIPCAGLVKGLNSLLPADIRIIEAHEASPDFHARCSAWGKTYVYHLRHGQIELPTERLYAAHVIPRLDVASMRACLPFLLGEHDFSSFEATGSRDSSFAGGRGAERRIVTAEIHDRADRPGRLRLIIVGDGFLRHMVRNIVGTLIEVGRGKRGPNDFAQVIAARDRTMAGPTAPACGLFLQAVHYRKPGSHSPMDSSRITA